MSITHCPTCKEPLHLWPSFTGGTCLFCINPHCSDNTEHPRLSPAPAQQSPSESIAAPAEVGQGLGTITCAACGSTNTEPCCHPAEFCQAICNDCNKPLNADGSLWVEKQEPTLEEFQRWLETEAHIVNSKYDEVLAGKGKGMSGRDWNKLTKRLAYLRAGFALVMQFKLEQGA